MKYSERSYPDWFIDELLNEDDKEKARTGLLKSTDKVTFKCRNNHAPYEQKVLHHIKLSTGERKQGCPICGELNRYKNRIKTISSKRVYPQWFIDELVNEEDKEKARDGSLMNHSKVEFKCDKCRNKYKQNISDHIKLSTGERKKSCPICGKVKNRKNIMKTVSSKRVYPEWFIDELVSEEDKNKARDGTLLNTSKVKFKCNKGHIYEQRVYDHIKLSTGERKYGCQICGKEKKIENRIKTISSKRVYPQWFIDELVNEEDKVKARDGIIASTSKLEFMCDKGHTYNQRVYDHIKLSTGENKYGCPVCGKVKNHKNRMKTISSKRVYPQWFIDELVNEEDKEKARDGSLMNHSKVEFKCDKGHIYKQGVNHHIKLSTGEKKYGCPICGKEKNIENMMKTISRKRNYPKWFIDELVSEEDKTKARNGTLMNMSKVEFKCDKGHIYKQGVNHHIKLSTGERKCSCSKCSNNRSLVELEIEGYVKSLGYVTQHKRFRDSNHKLFEIDIFIPEKNIGIEYNGSVYHSSENGIFENKSILYHYNKFNECRKKDILLITIFDVEYESRKEEIKQYIKDILNRKENHLSYDKEGYMNNNYPSWEHYKDNGEQIKDSYFYSEKQIVYTCGYTTKITFGD